MKKIVRLALVSLLLSTAVIVGFVRPVAAQGTIHIRADGSVDPPTPLIQRDGDLYTLTGNITSDDDGIVIERNNMTLDGACYTLQGTGSRTAIDMSYRSNVTIKNVEIKAFEYGVYLHESSNNFVSGNTVTANNIYGIYLWDSSNNNSIVGNNVKNSKSCGIYLYGYRGRGPCNNNIISGNNIKNSNYGIALEDSLNNGIVGNTLTDNSGGIGLDWSSNNIVSGNTVTDNSGGIVIVHYSKYNIVSGNIITKNNYGVYLSGCSFNNVYGNTVTGNSNTGIVFSLGSSNNTLYHNDFINNTRQVYDESWDNLELSSSNNTWDDYYPSGGNYWGDYTGIDFYSGLYQNVTGSDGIGDTPYVIDENNRDNYPLMSLWGAPTSALGIYPNRGGNAGSVTVNIVGYGFQQQLIVKLARQGYADIEGTNTKMPAPNLIITTFNLSGRAPGVWDLVVTLPSATELRLPKAFTIIQGGEPNLWISIVGRDQIRVGQTQTYFVCIYNRGIIDSQEVLIDVKVDEALKVMCIETMDGVVIWNRTAIEETIASGKATRPDLWEGEPEGIVEEFLNKTLLWIPNIASRVSFTLKVTVYAKMPWAGADPLMVLAMRFITPVGIDFIGHLVSQMFYFTLDPINETLWRTFLQAWKSAGEMLVQDLLDPFCWIQELSSGFVDWALSAHGREHIINILTSLGYSRGAAEAAATARPYVANFAKYWIAVLGGIQVGLEVYRKINDAADAYGIPITKANKPISPVMAIDPNDKAGPTGYGPQVFIPLEIEMPYIIYFENLENATASAENIVITDTLDADLDWSTLVIGDTSHPEVMNYTFDPITGTITWTFTNINLPPNKVPPEGEGWVAFSVKPKPGLSSGTEIRNDASIVFDNNPPMNTGEVINTIDSLPPTSSVSPLPTESPVNVTVNWSGSDDAAGVNGFAIWFSKDGGPYVFWIHTTETSVTFTGEIGHTYAFYSIAQDNAGNIEDPPVAPDTMTTIVDVDTAFPLWILVVAVVVVAGTAIAAIFLWRRRK